MTKPKPFNVKISVEGTGPDGEPYKFDTNAGYGATMSRTALIALLRALARDLDPRTKIYSQPPVVVPGKERADA